MADDLALEDVLTPEGFQELGLTVPLETGDADQFTGADLEVDRAAFGPKFQAPDR